MVCQCLDFAVSWDFWRAHCLQVHGYDPGSNEMLEEPTKMIAPEGNDYSIRKRLGELQGEITHIHKVHHEKQVERQRGSPSPPHIYMYNTIKRDETPSESEAKHE